MRIPSLFFALVLLICTQTFAQERLDLNEALAKKLIEITPRGLGGYQGKCLEIIIKNTSSQIVSLEIPAGQIFASEDSNIQDLVITQRQTLALGPNTQKKKQFYTMCTQAKNASPSKGEKYSLGKMAEPSLFKLVGRIDQGNYQNSSAQSAVWAISDREDIRNVYGEDTSMVRNLAEVISEERNIDIESFDLSPRRHHITSIKSSMEVLLKENIEQAKLILVDQEGNIIRRYFEDRFYERGFHQWKVGASHTLGDSAELYLRLFEGERLVSEKKVLVSDSITSMREFHSEAILSYEASLDLRADIGVFDQANNLYFLIKADHLIKKGFHRGRYIAKCLLPPNEDFFIKVISNGEVLAEKKADANQTAPKIYPKKNVMGVYRMNPKEAMDNVSIGVYDSEGRLKKVLYKIKHLNAGQRHLKYNFSHREGPGALFYIRTVSDTGEVLQEEEISSK
ncbi:MAG: hypothetical protein R8P61_14235 [Bacteroidia bacterium]|nr:hypothetical protein [Bacteroidia bacterium]